jgi:hypothetical protein
MLVWDSIVRADPEIRLLGVDYNTNSSTLGLAISEDAK